MTEAWKVLEAAGLPIGGPRPRPRGPIEPRAIRDAVEALAATGEGIEPELREPLLAWLAAWWHHWPSSFPEVLGPAGSGLAARLESESLDRNRYLKLRRIAVENLAEIL